MSVFERFQSMKKLLTIVLKIGIFFIGWAVCAGLIDIPSDDPAIWRLWAEAIPLLSIIVFSLVFWLIEKRKLQVVKLDNPIKNIIIGISTGIVWLGLAVAILTLSGTISFVGQNHIDLLAVWMISCVLNVVMQELLVRGYIYQLLKKEYNVFAAVIVSTALFTVMHVGAFEAGMIPVLNVITMSLFMTAVLEYTSSLIAPVLIHSIWNAFGAIILGGISLAEDYPHLLNTVFSGNVLLSGGVCKIEGSIVVLALNILLTVLFWRLNQSGKQSHESVI